jgi:hypothetical protein
MANKPDAAERERAFLRGARKEAEALKAAAAGAKPAAGAPPASPAARARPAPPAAGARLAPPAAGRTVAAHTPLDQPTVDGWSHPAARDAEPKVKIAAEEKWSRLAAIMEAEQRETREKRAKLRRAARQALIGITAVIILTVMFSLRR